MRLSLAATAAVTAAAGLVTTLAPAPAMAGPIKSPVLTNNALYRTGQFASGACRTPAMPNRGHAAVKSYLTTSFTCVNSAWAKHLSASGMALSRPGFTYFTKGDSPFCQVKAKDIMPGAYCNPTRTIGVILPQPVREYAPEVGFMLVMAHEYGHHVQNSMGMLAAASKERYPSRKAALEASRRYELQADCLAGVYISSIWDSQRRSVPEWGTLIALAWSLGGEKGSKTNDHGSGTNRARWFNKGFAAESPAACNTWTASSAKVA
ncbi:neutral zinc metallopeptidase [Nonomuraea sp. NBC_01738]|uniref:neutral zinc metallopeptidase n=1 Tax=Nonomuraea sp. NBC_01738 TaxID=2976003 RepID=UPI002E0E572C|nr:neutral zinc metallopeptidase [Nonomuraea sp. NBC_01738]